MRTDVPAARGWTDLARPLALAVLLPGVVLAIVLGMLAIDGVDGAQTDAADAGARTTLGLAMYAEAWPAIDAAARAAAEPVRSTAADRDAFRVLLAGTMAPDSLHAARGRYGALDADTTAWARLGVPRAAALARGAAVARGVRSDLPVRLDEERRAEFARHAESPWLAAWRRAAAAAEPPAAWQYRVGAPGVDGLLHAPAIDAELYRGLAWTNEEAAILELERGTPDDLASAVGRARENVAMAHLLARSPHPGEFGVGVQLLSDAGRLLRFAGERTGDGVAARDGERVFESLWRLPPSAAPATPRSPEAETAIAAALALAADRRLPPAVRAGAAVELVLASTCLTPRAMLLGPSTTLDASLRELSVRLADIDPEARLGPAIVRAGAGWDALTRGGEWRRTRRYPPEWATALEATGFVGLAGRVMACAER